MLTNPRDAFRGQSRSPNIVPFHMLGIFPLVRAIVTLSLRRAGYLIFAFKKCRDLEIMVIGHSRSLTCRYTMTLKLWLWVTQGHR